MNILAHCLFFFGVTHLIIYTAVWWWSFKKGTLNATALYLPLIFFTGAAVAKYLAG